MFWALPFFLRLFVLNNISLSKEDAKQNANEQETTHQEVQSVKFRAKNFVVWKIVRNFEDA